jgi:hypothetical protein
MSVRLPGFMRLGWLRLRAGDNPPAAPGETSGAQARQESLLPRMRSPGLRSASVSPETLVAEKRDVRRLVVLVPPAGLDSNGLVRQIHFLAEPCELGVHLLCVPGPAPDCEAAMRLRLATLGSSIRSRRVEVTTSVVSRQGWLGAVREVWRPGDIVLCCAEQTVTTAVSGRRLLCQVMEAALDVPVFVLTGLLDESPCFSQSSF